MRYRIKCVETGAGVTEQEIEAPDAQTAWRRARAGGGRVVSVTPVGWRIALTRPSRFPVLLFTQELIALLDAGLPLAEALDVLAEKEPRAEIRQVLADLLAVLATGKPFSAALAAQPALFSPLYVATVEAAETTGDLTVALGRYVAYQQQLESVRKKVVSASIYPLLLLAVGGLVIAFLLGYVVPRFAAVYADAGENLPWMSQVLLAWGELITAHGGLILLVSGMLAGGAAMLLTRPPVRGAIVRRLWRLPTLGRFVRTFQLARFYRSLGMLLAGGIAIVPALDRVRGLLGAELARGAARAREALRRGEPLSAALEAGGLATPVAARLVRVGEKSGRMGDMLTRTAQFHDDELARHIDWFTRLFEPLLMVAIGLVIGLVVVLLYLPIFELAGAIE